MLKNILFSAIISLTPSQKKIINNLETRLKKQGYDISTYLEDSRFELYKFKRKTRYIDFSDTTQSWYMKVDSLEKCADFIEENYYWLKKAEKEFGISPEYITSQLELETNRGQYTGKRPVLNSLISIYVARPDRRKEFYKYLVDFLDLAKDTTDNIILPKDIFEIKGSWAGAYGIAQMMPDVLKKYGKISDFDGDGFFDPMNKADAIGFMARNLFEHNFKENKYQAIQQYNHGHKFYGSSVEKHSEKLKEIMIKREKIPIKKINSIPYFYVIPSQTPRLKDMKLAKKYELPRRKKFLRRILL